ncbi:DHS-like NAD/FAD-binding domain-containing protein [Lentithecium fluviatile CBS 122367]|uniref:DHS-like NAD/FAD-binding domain-containing protein n=1 Tax=Lentithecium fluviatile CBS 122367 TaxID=1168545 RepID=A0A6G1IR38_9PLEO|nr:DHS-like NAD/FAD-binding domain-containing protein [Lentithecium fluviatile CBS 122367]
MAQRTVGVAQYLLARLHQLGVRSVHGVPGDYTLRALGVLKPAGLRWIGNCNELNAGYAADGYARLSALNAVAGSYAEYNPVKAYRSKSMVHHSLGDGDLHTAPAVIDQTLQAYVRERVKVAHNLLSIPLVVAPPTNPTELEDAVVNSVLKLIYASKQPYILVDGLVASDQIVDEVNEFAKLAGFPTFGLTFGGGIINGNLPNYHGVHAGKYGSLDFTSYSDKADLALLFGTLSRQAVAIILITIISGPLLSDTNTQGWSAVPRKDATIAFRRKAIEIRDSEVHALHQNSSNAFALPKLRDVALSLPAPDLSTSIDQDTFYLRISSSFRPYDIIVCENRTPLVGGRDFILPPSTTLVSSAIWHSVGHMLPATQGVALAQQELKTGGRTFFEGDGSFQATAQLIHGMNEDYNDVARWRYLMAPDMMGAPSDGSYEVKTHDVGTWGELMAVLTDEKFQNGKGLKMVNVRMARDDVTNAFKPALKLAGEQLMADPTGRRGCPNAVDITFYTSS